jgi:MFS family permease
MGRNLVKFLCLALLGSLLAGLLFGLFSGLYAVIHGTKDGISILLMKMLFNGQQLVLAVSPIFTLVGGLLGALTGGLSSDIMHERNLTTPNQGIRRSARYSLFVGSICMIIGGSIGALLGALITGTYDPKLLLAYALIFGILVGLTSGLRSGGIACIQHSVLRWQLWDNNFLPWNYVQFLDYAAEHLLLRKVGGGYMFMHRLLLEYFASLDEDEAQGLDHPVVGDKENA